MFRPPSTPLASSLLTTPTSSSSWSSTFTATTSQASSNRLFEHDSTRYGRTPPPPLTPSPPLPSPPPLARVDPYEEEQGRRLDEDGRPGSTAFSDPSMGDACGRCHPHVARPADQYLESDDEEQRIGASNVQNACCWNGVLTDEQVPEDFRLGEKAGGHCDGRIGQHALGLPQAGPGSLGGLAEPIEPATAAPTGAGTDGAAVAAVAAAHEPAAAILGRSHQSTGVVHHHLRRCRTRSPPPLLGSGPVLVRAPTARRPYQASSLASDPLLNTDIESSSWYPQHQQRQQLLHIDHLRAQRLQRHHLLQQQHHCRLQQVNYLSGPLVQFTSHAQQPRRLHSTRHQKHDLFPSHIVPGIAPSVPLHDAPARGFPVVNDCGVAQDVLSSSHLLDVASASSALSYSVNMAGEPPAHAALQEELAAQQQAAQDYHPELEGPVIGEKRPSETITEEYAKADPVYVEKTVNLPQTYSHFRPVQGDGNCGWRAIGFSYFEQLILAGDPDRLPLEVARVTSLNNYLTNVGGYDLDLFEDMVLETINLLKDLARCATDPSAAMTLLQNRFNDRECSNAIIYHLRLLAGSWLKGNAAQYEPFLDGAGDVASWAHQNIEVPDREIDHLSIILLTNILLKPADMVLEIAYLDRTPGTQVNMYRFPDEANGQDPANLGTIIYLLFRPDHYDILYKDSSNGGPPAPATPAHVNLQVNRAMSFSQQHGVVSNVPSLHDFSAMDYGTLAVLPGFGGPSSGLSALAAPTALSPVQEPYATPDQRSWMTHSHSLPPMQQTGPLAQSETQFQSYQQPPPPSNQFQSKGVQQPVDYQLRFSSQCFHLQNPSVESSSVSQGSFPELNCSNSMIKNGHFNKAHYRNPEFHPEEWTPEDENGERGGSCRKKIRSNPEE